ncbi:hypothetical protein Tco_1523954 [Tanacetum coccineum]
MALTAYGRRRSCEVVRDRLAEVKSRGSAQFPWMSNSLVQSILYTMANAEHAPAMAPPVRTDEQILPRIRWVPIGKRNCYLNEEKSQPSLIFKIVDTICFDSKAGSYKCQLDKQWFDLTQDTLRDALQITPVDKNSCRFSSSLLTPDTLYELSMSLGYPREGVILQRFLEKILTYAYPNSKRGSSPPVYFNEPDDLETSNHCQRFRSGAQDEGQDGPDLGTLDKGQAGPNLDDVAESQPLPTPSVLAGPNLEHSDVEITDPSSQPQPEHMDEGFTAAAYPDVQENLKLTVDEHVILEEPVSSIGTLSSLQHLAKDFSFSDQFLNDKPSEADNEKTTANTEAELMVSVTIQQDIFVFPPMTSSVIGPMPRPDSPNVHWPLPTTTTTTAATTTTTLPLPPQPQQGPLDPTIIKRMGELEA